MRSRSGECVGGCVKPNFDQELCAELEEANVTAPTGTLRIDLEDHLDHRYLVILDGSGYPNRLYWQAFSNSLLLVPQTGLLSWLKPESQVFRPYEHYLPVRGDLSDLLSVWRWAESHSNECRAMAHAAQQAAREVFTTSAVLQYLAELLEGYAERQRRARRICSERQD